MEKLRHEAPLVVESADVEQSGPVSRRRSIPAIRTTSRLHVSTKTEHDDPFAANCEQPKRA
jgi:hypothetical protein